MCVSRTIDSVPTRTRRLKNYSESSKTTSTRCSVRKCVRLHQWGELRWGLLRLGSIPSRDKYITQVGWLGTHHKRTYDVVCVPLDSFPTNRRNGLHPRLGLTWSTPSGWDEESRQTWYSHTYEPCTYTCTPKINQRDTYKSFCTVYFRPFP